MDISSNWLSGNLSIRNMNSTNHTMNQSTLNTDYNTHKIELYGPLLPVLVVEAISTESLSFQSLSVKISDHGWAWLVCGRRLFIWKYKDDSSRLASACFELDLPPSDLSHKAELVTLILPDSTKHSERNAVGLIAVSPEGSLRYWPNVAYESHSIETSVSDIHGEECFMLTNLNQTTCLLGTTTNTLVSITISDNDTMTPVSFRRLRAPQGVLAGFSKRVSSFIFGGAPSAQSSHERTMVRIVGGLPNEDSGESVMVLAGTFIQKWSLSGKSEQLTYEVDLDRLLRNAYVSKVWGNQNSMSPQLQMWCVDFQFQQNKLFVLVVCGNTELHAHLSYGLAVFEDQSSAHTGPVHTPIHISMVSFHLLTNHPIDVRSTYEDLLNSSYLLIEPSQNLLYVYDRSKVLCIHSMNYEVIDIIDFGDREDGILGAGFDSNGAVLLFTFRDALVTLVPNKELISARNISLPSINIQEPMEDDLNEQQENMIPNCHNTAAENTSLVGSSIAINNSFEPNAVNSNELKRNSTSNLHEQTEARKELRWIDYIENNRYADASQALLELCGEEKEHLSRKKTLLSLSKLAALASGTVDVGPIDELLDDVLCQQKQL